MRLAVTLACLLMAPAALAAETITLPSPWTSGTVLTYREQVEERIVDGDEIDHIIDRQGIEIRMVTNALGERVQRWTVRDADLEVIDAPPTMRRVYEELGKTQRPPMEFRLDAEGRYAGVANSVELAQWMARFLTPAAEDMLINSLLATGEAEDRDEAALMAKDGVAEVISIFTTPERIENFSLWPPTLYNAWSGAEWETGRDYVVERVIPFDALMRALPGTWTFRFTVLDGGKARVDWTAEVQYGSDGFKERGHARFDRTSGVIEWLDVERTERLENAVGTRRQTLSLETAATP